MRLTGHCHCGNLRIQFETAEPPEQLPLRACQCTFCLDHGALSTSDPAGSVSVTADAADSVQRYRFGLKITEFLICKRCGVYVLAMVEVDGGQYAVINANTLDCREQMTALPQPMDYDGETIQTRLARRKTRWTPVASIQGL
jgi:hypothetical protein